VTRALQILGLMRPGITAHDVCVRLACTPGAASSAINRLLRRGHIYRFGFDGSRWIYRRTPRGVWHENKAKDPTR
jgi:hypothetical protein